MIGLVCGGGDYPRLIARACEAQNEQFCLVFLKGFCDESSWPAVDSVSIELGQVERALNFLHENNVTDVIFAGNVKRPNFSQMSLDKKGTTWLLKLGRTIFDGDDALLRAIADLMAQEGFQIKAGSDYLNDIFLEEGVFSKRTLSDSDQNDAEVGFQAARSLGAKDAGQSVVIYNGAVVATEDENGTNNLIERSAKLRRSPTGGILVKTSKPQQDNRLDLPTIGVDTVENLHRYGFNGIVVESGKCIVLNKQAVIDKINEYNMFIAGVAASPLKVFIIAGEASGDYLGGRLMQDIREITDNNVEFFGIGGSVMSGAGLKCLFSTQELSIIGILEVIGKIFRIKKMINKTVKEILAYNPHVVVTIDSSGFTHRVAKQLKRHTTNIPVVHYVAPPVWAWRQWRAKNMHRFIDKLMVLLPFEAELFSKHHLDTVFVGHPIAVDKDFEKPSDERIHNFKRSYKLEGKKIITLLPGSRDSEIRKHMPILREFVNLMEQMDAQFIIPTIPALENTITELTRDWKQSPVILTSKAQKVLAYYSSDAAVAASGTVTLELARVGLPFVVIYKTSALTYKIVKSLIHVSHVCLVNILAKKTIVPELLQDECTAWNIFKHVSQLLKTNLQQTQEMTDVIKSLTAPKHVAAMEVIKSARRS